ALYAGDGADERRFAGAVRADDGHDRALRHLERHAIERLRVAVKELEVANAQHAPPPMIMGMTPAAPLTNVARMRSMIGLLLAAALAGCASTADSGVAGRNALYCGGSAAQSAYKERKGEYLALGLVAMPLCAMSSDDMMRGYVDQRSHRSKKRG